jgi:hypothetical protein
MYKEVGVVDPSSTLDRQQFGELLTRIDSGLRALPATAQASPILVLHVAPACACPSPSLPCSR